MDKQFIIKIFNYIDGELQVIANAFERLEEAIEHGLQQLCHSFKIFDHLGELCHEHHHHDDCHDGTYA